MSMVVCWEFQEGCLHSYVLPHCRLQKNIKLAYRVASDRSADVIQEYDRDNMYEADLSAALEEGREEGSREEGREEGKKECAKRMKLSSVATDIISSVTGFSKEYIKSIDVVQD